MGISIIPMYVLLIPSHINLSLHCTFNSLQFLLFINIVLSNVVIQWIPSAYETIKRPHVYYFAREFETSFDDVRGTTENCK